MSESNSVLRNGYQEGAAKRPQTFKKGKSGNPGGRRPLSYKLLSDKMKTLDPDVFEMTREAIRARPITHINILAATFARDTGHGKPAIRVDGSLEVRVGMTDEMRDAHQRAKRMILEGIADVVEEIEREESSA